MPDPNGPHELPGLTAGELEQADRDLRASLALARPDPAMCGPILPHLRADAELAERRTCSTVPVEVMS